MKPVAISVALDVSKNLEDEHICGQSSDVLKRIEAWAASRSLPMSLTTFASSYSHLTDLGTVTPFNVSSIISEDVIGQVPGWGCRGNYAPVVVHTLAKYGWSQNKASRPISGPGKLLMALSGKTIPERVPVNTSRGILKALLGAEPDIMPSPSLAISFIVTDGCARDFEQTQLMLSAAQAINAKVFFVFLGISNQPHNFDSLQKLERANSNVGFLNARNVHNLADLSDEGISSVVLTPKAVQWLWM